MTLVLQINSFRNVENTFKAKPIQFISTFLAEMHSYIINSLLRALSSALFSEKRPYTYSTQASPYGIAYKVFKCIQVQPGWSSEKVFLFISF